MKSVKERASELQRQYLREWRARNPEKVKGYAVSYWERKARAERSQKNEEREK